MLANQSIPRLDTFGISAGKVRERIGELTTGSNALTREQAFMQATMEEAAVSMERVGEQSGSTAGEMAKLETAWNNMVDAQKEAIASSDALKTSLQGLTGFISAYGALAEAARVGAISTQEASLQLAALTLTGKNGADVTEEYTRKIILYNNAEIQRASATEKAQKAAYAAADALPKYTTMAERAAGKTEELGTSARELAERLAALTPVTNQWQHSAGLTADEVARLTGATEDLTEAVDDGSDKSGRFAAAQDRAAEAARKGKIAQHELSHAVEEYESAIVSVMSPGGAGAIGDIYDDYAEAALAARDAQKQLTSALGDYFTEAIKGEASTDSLAMQLMNAADAAGAGAYEMAILAMATGEYTEAEMKAALEAAIMQAKIQELAAAVADGTLSARDAITAFQEFQVQLAEGYVATVEINDESARSKLKQIADMLDNIDGRSVSANVNVNTTNTGDKSGENKGPTGPNNTDKPTPKPSAGPPDGNQGDRAIGGPVTAGRRYRVGERGFEEFIPSTNGMIIPNSQAGGGGGPVTFNITQQPGQDGAALAREINRVMGRAARTARNSGAGATGRTI